jgi:hypothetical protein
MVNSLILFKREKYQIIVYQLNKNFKIIVI